MQSNIPLKSFGFAPLFVKFQTKSGGCYLYDAVTNEILRVNEIVYFLVDDLATLSDNEIVAKYGSAKRLSVCSALMEIRELQKKGYLCGHSPEIVAKAEMVSLRGKDLPFSGFLASKTSFLNLELTQQCNLRCQYCCYGEHYAHFRKHGEKNMSWEIAWKAVQDYLDKSPEIPIIGFYGGEPLLKFDLLQRIVVKAKSYAEDIGFDLSFNITTNGTLLTDAVIHFLAEHRFGVLVSLDGTKKAHDRYRVFRKENREEPDVGSFDVVMKNLKRFQQLYPDYPTRGFALTITAQSEIEETNDLIKSMRPAFSMLVPSFVRNVTPSQKSCSEDDQPFQWGCLNTCGGGTCCRDSTLRDAKSTSDFNNWTQKWGESFRESYENFVDQLIQGKSDILGVKQNYPLLDALFFSRFHGIHYRNVPRLLQPQFFFYTCYPGATRTFCSATGKYYPCERIETNSFTELGDVETGIDAHRSIRLLDIFHSLADCGNCVARNLCSICPAAIYEIENKHVDTIAFQNECETMIKNLPNLLAEYTEIMERDPNLLDAVLKEDSTPHWSKELKFYYKTRPEIGVEELSPDNRLF